MTATRMPRVTASDVWMLLSCIESSTVLPFAVPARAAGREGVGDRRTRRTALRLL